MPGLEQAPPGHQQTSRVTPCELASARPSPETRGHATPTREARQGRQRLSRRHTPSKTFAVQRRPRSDLSPSNCRILGTHTLVEVGRAVVRAVSRSGPKIALVDRGTP